MRLVEHVLHSLTSKEFGELLFQFLIKKRHEESLLSNLAIKMTRIVKYVSFHF
jgi:hypothetical protein